MGFQKSKVPPGGSTAITAFITPLRRFLSNSDPSHPRGEERRRRDRDQGKEARSAEGATGTRKEARSGKGATGTKQRGEERRRRDRDQERGEERRRRDRDQGKRRGAPKARPGPRKEARSAESATGTKERGEE